MENEIILNMLPNKFIIEEARGSLRTPFVFFQVLTKAYAIFGALAKYVSYLFPKFIFLYRINGNQNCLRLLI